jgi:hypothetical protein
MENLIKTALQDIHVPLDQIPPTPPIPTTPGSENNCYGEHLESDFDESMGENRNR